jgi:hypothetical protein
MPGEVPGLVGENTNTQDAAEEEAAMVLRAKNIKEFHSVLTTAGTLCFPNGVAIESGVVVTLKNKGIFDGNWIIQKVMIHIAEGKLISEIELRKCLIPIKGTTIQYIEQPTVGNGNGSGGE